MFFVCFFPHDDTSVAGKTNEVLQKKKIDFFSLSFLNSFFVFPFTFGWDVLNVRKMTPPKKDISSKLLREQKSGFCQKFPPAES